MKHVAETHKDRKPGCEYGCIICDGGLFICTVCGCIEGSLASECPGYQCYSEYGDRIYKGETDFREGKWVEGAISPASPKSAYLIQEKLKNG